MSHLQCAANIHALRGLQVSRVLTCAVTFCSHVKAMLPADEEAGAGALASLHAGLCDHLVEQARGGVAHEHPACVRGVGHPLL